MFCQMHIQIEQLHNAPNPINQKRLPTTEHHDSIKQTRLVSRANSRRLKSKNLARKVPDQLAAIIRTRRWHKCQTSFEGFCATIASLTKFLKLLGVLNVSGINILSSDLKSYVF